MVEEKRQRTAVVVGGSRGIGRAAALDLARRDVGRIIINYVADEDSASEAVSMLREANCDASSFRGDASNQDDVKRLATEVKSRFGQLDILVYSAGYRTLGDTMEVAPAQLQRAFDVCVTGFVLTVQALSPLMPAGGKVVGVSGLSGVRAYSTVHLAMGAAKAAVHQATKYLALSLAPRTINVNSVCFGAVLTEGVTRDLTPEQYEKFITASQRKIPLGHVPEPEVVARVIGFLASDDAAWLVGQTLIADGGETLS